MSSLEPMTPEGGSVTPPPSSEPIPAAATPEPGGWTQPTSPPEGAWSQDWAASTASTESGSGWSPAWTPPPPPTQASWGGDWHSPPPPPSSPWAAGGGAAPPPPPAAKKRRGFGMLAAALALAVASAGVGAAAGAAVAHSSNNPTATAERNPAALPGSGSTGSGAAGSGSTGSGSAGSGFGSNGSGSGSSGSGSSGTTAPSTGTPVTSAAAAAVAAQVDPAVVDITTTLGYQSAKAAGTGMVISSSGQVLTNNHVIDGATKITAQIAGAGTVYTAKVLGTDPTSDVALIQLEGVSGMKTVKIGDATKVVVGNAAIAIGNALNLPGPPSVTSGTITALNQSITAGDEGGGNSENLTGLLETDALLRPGNSGGPLVDTNGAVIGMNTAASTGSSRFSEGSNVGYAIPINTAVSIANEIAAGHASATIHIGLPAFLGVQIQSASTSGGLGGSASSANGVVVAQVPAGTPAASAGLAAGDVITAVGGKTVSSPSDLTSVISTHRPGDTVKVTWTDQSGNAHTANVQLATGPAD
jgi:S1-C subfamily serine protease